jgi:hypothetical protein
MYIERMGYEPLILISFAILTLHVAWRCLTREERGQLVAFTRAALGASMIIGLIGLCLGLARLLFAQG